MKDYREATDEEAIRALEHMGDVSDRIRHGKMSYKAGLAELTAAGMTIGDAEIWLEDTTTAEQRRLVVDR